MSPARRPERDVARRRSNASHPFAPPHHVPLQSSLRRVLTLGLTALALLSPARAAGPVQFTRDIRPLLSDNCFACHGPDLDSRKGKLRLDTKEGLFGETRQEGPVVTPGSLEKSSLWKRLITEDKDDRMPPPESHKEVKPEQREKIKEWILAGAPWQSHWAFEKPSRPALPAVRDAAWGRNPIDAFILSRLEEKNLAPAPEADRRTLARRVSFDLTGLPPKPADVERFVQDRAKDAYERYVRRLLASPHYGEHRARYWLDAARYADTHGLHFDNYREIWPYREWVIGAFNRNLPFDQFTVEQLAGDLLDEATQDDLVATGFHRCCMTTNEGGTIEEENLALYANDRVTTTSWVWLGLTANCAACHDHKFDPVTMKDFYSMAAFFRNTTQGAYDGNVRDSGPSITVFRTREDRLRYEALPALIAKARDQVEAQRREAEPQFLTWRTGLKADAIQRAADRTDLLFHAPLRDGNLSMFTATLSNRVVRAQASGPIALRPDGPLGPAPVFGKGATAAFEDAGDFDHGQAFSVGTWVHVPKDYDATAALVSRMDDKNDYRGWDLFIQKKQFSMHIVHQWQDKGLKVRTKDIVKAGEWQHVMATYDGSGKPGGVRFYVDGVRVEVEVENNKTVKGTLRTKVPLKLAQRGDGSHFDEGALQDVRLYARVLAPVEALAVARPGELARLLAQPVSEWNPEFRANLFSFYLNTRHRPFQRAEGIVRALEKEREALKENHPVTLVQQEKKDSQPTAHILFRGQYDQKREAVGGGVFSVLHAFPKGAPTNRLGLAQWIVSPENPLTARVIVNRYWQEVFGVGLVKTSEDFGSTGEPPVNPALLDWLAVEFRESGWDVKHLFTLMLTSSAYRQSAAVTPGKLEQDPANRLLSRGPRYRLDAEMLRDAALASSGLLAPRIGGPSVKPYQPDGLWEAVAMPESDTKKYERSQGEGLYRRSLYTFWKRAAPPASMDVLNAPSREVSCTRRERTNTPLQALATLNDPQFIEAARRLAENALRKHRNQTERALAFIATQVLLRPLAPEESRIVNDTCAQLMDFYSSHPDEARKLVAQGESKPDPKLDASRLATLTLVANQLMNLDEALNK
jgi:mono/diheme cytochrome c family protein